MTSDLEPDEVEWVTRYAASVHNAFKPMFESAYGRFADGERLLSNFQRVVDDVLATGKQGFRAVDEAHNELCIAAALVSHEHPAFANIAYEPPLANTPKTIDFRAATSELTVYVDVKTIKPGAHDRWEQYERALREGWMANNAEIQLSKEWLGGELWHNAFTARARMLQHTVELEEKVILSGIASPGTFFILALCGGGFHWREDELEDFVFFYFSGNHLPGDPFGPAELKYVDAHGFHFTRSINRFACMFRPQGQINAKHLNWQVSPPRLRDFVE